MRPALERRHTPANEAGHYILRSEAGIPQLALNPVEGVYRPHCGLRIISPVLHRCGRLIHEWQQIKQILVGGVLHIEEALLPFFT
jgi:hypothetical protein